MRPTAPPAEECTHLDCAGRFALATLGLDCDVVHLAAQSLYCGVVGSGNRAALRGPSIRAQSRLIYSY